MTININNNAKHIVDLHISPAGQLLEQAKKALIMIHGRGGTAEDILQLGEHLNIKEYALMAPQATGNTWYPQSFMAPVGQNEPWLSSAIDVLHKTVHKIIHAGIPREHIYFFGFSQGACLALEYITRNATRYGGAVALIGGLIGDALHPAQYKGDFKATPVFIGTSNPDMHVPIERVFATQYILQDMNANVTLKAYPGFGHSINQDEIDQANQLIFT